MAAKYSEAGLKWELLKGAKRVRSGLSRCSGPRIAGRSDAPLRQPAAAHNPLVTQPLHVLAPALGRLVYRAVFESAAKRHQEAQTLSGNGKLGVVPGELL
jgi:hypothetical protein